MARIARKTAARRSAPDPRPRPRVDREARKADYLRAAARVFLSKGPAASMQDVSDAAGAPKPVFYRIFPSRADLIDALFGHVRDTLVQTQQGEWDGYGWALRVLYIEAKKDPEIFLVALKTFRGDPAFEAHRQHLFDLAETQALQFFDPSPGAPPGGAARARLACTTLSSMAFDTLVAWLENRDGLTDDARFIWWGRIVREWRKATREAFQLDAPSGKPKT